MHKVIVVLQNFCLNNNLTMMNPEVSQRKKVDVKCMWESPDGEAKAMMDFILLVNEM